MRIIQMPRPPRPRGCFLVVVLAAAAACVHDLDAQSRSDEWPTPVPPIERRCPREPVAPTVSDDERAVIVELPPVTPPGEPSPPDNAPIIIEAVEYAVVYFYSRRPPFPDPPPYDNDCGWRAPRGSRRGEAPGRPRRPRPSFPDPPPYDNDPRASASSSIAVSRHSGTVARDEWLGRSPELDAALLESLGEVLSVEAFRALRADAERVHRGLAGWRSRGRVDHDSYRAVRSAALRMQETLAAVVNRELRGAGIDPAVRAEAIPLLDQLVGRLEVLVLMLADGRTGP